MGAGQIRITRPSGRGNRQCRESGPVFSHVVAPLAEGKVNEFLLENGVHPFPFRPSPPVSLLFLSLTRLEKKRRPWGGSSLLENRSAIMGGGNVLPGRFWGESFPGEMLHGEPQKFRIMSRAVRGQMHMLRPYGYRKGRRHGNSRRMIPLAPAVMGMRVFHTDVQRMRFSGERLSVRGPPCARLPQTRPLGVPRGHCPFRCGSGVPPCR